MNAHLTASVVDDLPGPRGWTRRRFLQAVAAGAAAGASLGSLVDELLGGELPIAWAGAPLGAHDGVIVVVSLYGGNDGLNTVVPYTNGDYRRLRGAVSIAADAALPINDEIGLHPSLSYVRKLYDVGQVAIVQGVGYSHPNLSHFSSMATWMKGNYANTSPTGWLGRWLDGLGGAGTLAGVSVATSVPLHMIGDARRGVAIAETGGLYGTDQRAVDLRLYDALRQMASASAGRGAWHDQLARSMSQQLDIAHDAAPVFGTTLPAGQATRKLTMAARLINADIGLRVIDIGVNGFDTHEHQLDTHARLLQDLDTGLRAFYATLSPALASRVTVVTVSEFGRTPAANGSAGTDHGTASPQLVIGPAVRGGLYGAAPSLTSLDENGRLVASLDFRTLYGSLIDGWLGGGGSGVLGGAFEDLHLFRTAAGDVPVGPAAPIEIVLPATASGFVPLVPQRAFDTRDGTGGRSTPLTAGEWWNVPFGSAVGIPADAIALAMNLTAVDATAPSFVTVWPTGGPRPFTANLNPVPGRAVPNLVVVGLGDAQSVTMFNNTGTVHLVGDIVGYFSPASDVGLEPLTPARLLDTRDGTGGLQRKVGAGETVAFQVAGRGGASGDCAAVAINVTVTEPTEPSFLTAFPSGAPRPLAASINMVAGQTVPNLVLACVGSGGMVELFNHGGETHVVVDLLGCFGAAMPGRFVSVRPSRVLDTRDGTGSPARPVGADPLRLSLQGVGQIPWHGATAVLLNMTVVGPTADTFVTVYPSDADRPLAANLNAVAGQVVPNMVLARLGADGSVLVHNHAGDVDLVADVMGYFAG